MEISLAGWSIHRRFRAEENPLGMLDYPKVSAEEFGIHTVELNSPFFEYDDPDDQAGSNVKESHLDELIKRADDAGVRMLNIAVDGHGDLASTDEAERKQGVENHKKWFDICLKLGCNSFRANTGGRGDGTDEEKLNRSTQSFTELTELGEQTGVRVMIENHGGVSVSPENIIHIMDQVGSDHCRVLADFLNWPKEDDYLANLKKVAPYAWAIHGKFLSFDDAGESNEIDCGAAIKILKDAGYDNPWGIEYEGRTDDHEGVLKSKALLEKHLS